MRREVQGGFPVRTIEHVDIDGLPENAPELVLSSMLAELGDLREARLAAGPRSARQAGLLVLGTLKQRLLSSLAAFRRTASVHAHASARTSPVTLDLSPRQQQLLLNAPDQDDDLDTLEIRNDEAVETATGASLFGPADMLAQEQALLERMVAIADGALNAPERRVAWLIAWIDARCARVCKTDGRDAGC